MGAARRALTAAHGARSFLAFNGSYKLFGWLYVGELGAHDADWCALGRPRGLCACLPQCATDQVAGPLSAVLVMHVDARRRARW
jgi:hypothetical protein